MREPTSHSYFRPAITDRGTLVELTEDLDVSLVGVATKVVTMAASSGAMGILPGSDGSILPDTDSGSGPDTGDTLPNSSSGTNPGAGATLPSSGSGTTPTSGEGVAGAGGSGAGGGGGGGGELPFTGYGLMLVAGVGAAIAGTGAAIRSRVTRRDAA